MRNFSPSWMRSPARRQLCVEPPGEASVHELPFMNLFRLTSRLETRGRLLTIWLYKHSLRAAVLAAATFSLNPGIFAQTLEHRSPDKLAVPTEPAAGTHDLKGPPVLAAGTSMQVEIVRPYPMKAGEAIQGRLVYPLYVDGKLAVPENTPVRGTVTALEPDSKARWQGRLQGDFTPFHNAKVQFNEMDLPDGARSITTSGASTGAMVLRLTAAGARPKQSLIGQKWSRAKERLDQQIAFFTDPGLGDRAMQMLYHQLPYHP